jgi:DNA-binding transcriptional regulator PaaX
MVKDELLSFTKMMEKGNVTRSTLARLIKDGKIKKEKSGEFYLYSLKDVINNKPRKK